MSKTINFYNDSNYEIIDNGSFNTIYEIKSGGNKGKALRINNKPLSKQEVYYLINESLSYIKARSIRNKS